MEYAQPAPVQSGKSGKSSGQGLGGLPTLLANTQAVIAEALEILGYDKQMYELLKEPVRLLTVRFPVRMDDGSVRVFTGYRAQHNDAVGPTKGGIRFHPDITEEDIKALAAWMSVRCGIANLPYGGAMGAVVCDPRELSFSELERVSRAYVRAISQVVGPTKDIPSPDGSSHTQTMAWMLDEYSRIREHDSPGFITGKPLVLGGTRGRDGAVARGIAICLEEAVKERGLELSQARAIVQGFGRVGSHLAKYLASAGAHVIGIADAHGALYDERGLDVDELLERRDSFGTVTKLFKHRIANTELLTKPCDILVLAAVENQITDENVHEIKAQIVVEAANGACAPSAAKRLSDAGTLVVPDVLCNSGGVIVSYMEWVQNNLGYYWTESEVDEKLAQTLRESFRRVRDTARRYKTDMRLAAYITGVRRLAEAVRWRGWI